jgi:sulfur-oxidizing protein SoxA
VHSPRATFHVLAFLCGLCVLCGDRPASSTERPTPLKGGIEFQSADVKALEADDFANPGMLWVTRGEALWSQPRGEAKASCASCHEASRMKGAAARYPRFDAALGRVVNLEGRINACVTDRQRAPRLAFESEELLSLSAFVARQSRGMPIAVSVEGPAGPVFEAGRRLYATRIGQLHLACTNCHDASWGKTLLAESISQGHPNGWPAYRLEWQSMGSLERRLRACFFGVRAEMPAYGSDDMLALELYLAWRAQGLASTAPGVRR